MKRTSWLLGVLVIGVVGCNGTASVPCGGRCTGTEACVADRCQAVSCPSCADVDGDGISACGPGPGVCDCDDVNPAIHPGAVDVCGNGIDEDCSGEPGGRGGACDADTDGFPSDVDCDDHDPLVHPGPLALELCNDVDDNCNGLVDELASCTSADLDGDGSDACATATPDCAACDCDDCDPGVHPGAADVCGDTIDEDGVGGDLACAAGDADHDGLTGGQDCDEGDPHVHLDAPENCQTPVSESCGSRTCGGVDADADGFTATSAGGSDCDDGDAEVHPWALETCNGVDDDCDGDADEVLDPARTLGCITDPSCTAGMRCVVDFDSSVHHCGGCGVDCNVGATLVADTCRAGTCSCSTNTPSSAPCAVGTTCCGAETRHPGCADLDTDVGNCGGCGVACDPATSDACVAGACACGVRAPCEGGLVCHGGVCGA